MRRVRLAVVVSRFRFGCLVDSWLLSASLFNDVQAAPLVTYLYIADIILTVIWGTRVSISLLRLRTAHRACADCGFAGHNVNRRKKTRELTRLWRDMCYRLRPIALAKRIRFRTLA